MSAQSRGTALEQLSKAFLLVFEDLYTRLDSTEEKLQEISRVASQRVGASKKKDYLEQVCEKLAPPMRSHARAVLSQLYTKAETCTYSQSLSARIIREDTGLNEGVVRRVLEKLAPLLSKSSDQPREYSLLPEHRQSAAKWLAKSAKAPWFVKQEAHRAKVAAPKGKRTHQTRTPKKSLSDDAFNKWAPLVLSTLRAGKQSTSELCTCVGAKETTLRAVLRRLVGEGALAPVPNQTPRRYTLAGNRDVTSWS